MSYDLHRVWDAASKFIGSKIALYTNITKINLSLDLLWCAGVKPKKVVIGKSCKSYIDKPLNQTDLT